MDKNKTRTPSGFEGDTPEAFADTPFADGGIDTEIENAFTSETAGFHVYPENTPRDVMDYMKENKKPGFCDIGAYNFKYNGIIYSDKDITFGRLGMKNRDRLIIIPVFYNA